MKVTLPGRFMTTRIGKTIRIKPRRRMSFAHGFGLMATCSALLMIATGCFPIRHGGKTYHVILGAGVIRVSQTNEVTVVKATSLGVYAGDGRVNIGVSSIYSARVPTNANLILEVTK